MIPVTRWRPLLLMLLLCGTSAFGYLGRPHIFLADVAPIDLEQVIPMQFGAWHSVPVSASTVVDPGLQRMISEAYTQQVTRTYVREDGYAIMLSVAYGRDQRGTHMAHLPNVCYPAQGFQTDSVVRTTLSTQFGPLPVDHMLARLGARIEPVSFWLTEGDTAIKSAWERRWVAVRYGFNGQIPDGMLFRVSSIDSHADTAYGIQGDFVRSLLGALSPNARQRIAGVR